MTGLIFSLPLVHFITKMKCLLTPEVHNALQLQVLVQFRIYAQMASSFNTAQKYVNYVVVIAVNANAVLSLSQEYATLKCFVIRNLGVIATRICHSQKFLLSL